MSLKDRNNLIALVGALATAIAIFYVYSTWLFKPVRKDITETKAKVAALDQKLAVTRARAQQLGQMQQEMAGLQIELANLEKQLPKDRELPALLRVLSRRAEGYGIVIGTISPQKPVSKGLYDELAYNIAATTSYHALAHFLVEMGKGERLFAARNLTLSAASSKTDPTKTVNATFQLIAFQYHG
jgi:type IV pilus assembly protein PilO